MGKEVSPDILAGVADLNNTSYVGAFLPTIASPYVGEWSLNDVYPNVMVTMACDVAGTLFFEFYDQDGTTPTTGTTPTSTFPVTGFQYNGSGFNEFHQATKGPRWFRVRFVPDSDLATTFRMNAYFVVKSEGNLPINQTIGSDQDAIISRAIPEGNLLDDSLNPTDDYAQVGVLPNKALSVGLAPAILVRETVSIPTGSTVTIDPVLNTEPNVYDTGWLPSSAYHSQLFHAKLDGATDIFLLNSPDTAGTNFTGGDFPFATTSAGIPTVGGAMFFQGYFRAVVVNTSGTTVTGDIESEGHFTALGNLLTRIDAIIFGFFTGTPVIAMMRALAQDTTYKSLTTQTVGGRESLNTTVNRIEDDIAVEPVDDWSGGEVVVGSTPVQLDPVKHVGRRSVAVINQSLTQTVFVGPTSVPAEITTPLFPRQTRTKMLSDQADVWAVIKGSPSVETVVPKLGSTASGTASSPSNALVDDAAYASFTAAGQTLDVDGFTATGITNIAQITLCLKAKKSATPASKTAAFVDTVSGTGGNVATVVSGTVTSNADHTYYAFVSRRNTSSSVTSVTGLGLTWSPAVSDAIGGRSRVSCWVATGTPTGNGTVTATFDLLPTNSTIQVVRVANGSQLQAIEGITGSSTVYSDSISATNLGEALVFAGFDNTTHTAGSGFTERLEVSSGTGSNTSTSALSTLDITTTGLQPYSGTFGSSTQWAVIALTALPDDTDAPVINVGYELSAVAGATTGMLSFNSTTDEIKKVDITPDRAWLPTDLPNLKIKTDADSVGAASCDVNLASVEIVDSTGVTVRVSLEEL